MAIPLKCSKIQVLGKTVGLNCKQEMQIFVLNHYGTGASQADRT